MVQFTLARALPTPLGPPSGNVLIPYLRRQQVPWGLSFNIFWQSASSSTLWYNLLWLARFQPRSAPPPGMFWSHIYGDSKSLGAEYLTYSDRAHRVLPYGTVYLGSVSSYPARPPLREGFLIPYLRWSKSLGAEFLTYSDRARRVVPNGTVFFGSLASNPALPPLREGFLNPYLRRSNSHWGRMFNIFWQSASSSTLWYSLPWLASFQPRSATAPGRFFYPIFAGEQVPWGRILNIFWKSASSSTLSYSLLWFARFQLRSATPPGRLFDPIFAGEQVPWGRVLKIFWQSASSSTLWYSLLRLARFQPRSATPPGRFFDPIFCGWVSPLGPKF